MRWLASDTHARAVAPSVVVRDDLREHVLHEYHVTPELFEMFYALSAERRFQHPLLKTVLEQDEQDLLESSDARLDGD